MQCLQLTMDFIRSLGHWGYDPQTQPLLPAVDRQFPPPDTILTAPKQRPQPLTSDTVRSSTSSLGFPEAGQSPSVARQSLERLRRNDTISSNFSGRMKPLRTSQPPTPTTAQSRHFSTNNRTTSSASTPLTRLRMPMPPFPFSTIESQRSSPQRREGSRTQPLPTPEAGSSRPAFPIQMARSVSEPQGMSDMTGFAAHQMVRSRSGSISVTRGRPINRPRAATGSTTAIERLANLSTHVSFSDTRRGRSPGPRSAGLGSGRPSPLGSAADVRPILPARSISSGLLSPAPDVPIDVDQESNDGEVAVVEEEAVVTGEEGVVRRDLGLRGLFPGQRGRRRGRAGRGRAIAH